MRKKLLVALAAAAVLLGGLVTVVAVQPSAYRIERSAVIAAPPAAVFAPINDFRAWDSWSPWAKLDPNAKSTFEGPPSGVGAVFGWSGNEKVGEGRMTILESVPDELIRMRVDFVKPFADTCLTEFAFKPEAGGTAVTWVMTGERNFIAKAVCLVMDLDACVGGDIEKGLASIKTVAEARPAGE